MLCYDCNKLVLSILLHFNIYGYQAFSAAGTMIWNFLPDLICDLMIIADCLRHLLKCSHDTIALSVLKVPDDNCAIVLLTYLLVIKVLQIRTTQTFTLP